MGKTLQYVSEFTFPSSGKTAAKGYAHGGHAMAKGGAAMGGMKSTKPAASPAPKSDMLYSKKENTAKTLLADGKGAPMPHARGSVNMAKGGMSKVGKVMDEYKAGELHSGSKTGPMVTNRKQAVAIGMSEARKASKK